MKSSSEARLVARKLRLIAEQIEKRGTHTDAFERDAVLLDLESTRLEYLECVVSECDGRPGSVA